jgi:LacI family transcriptional regulator
MHRHRVRDIADQAGLSPATVDRVLNHRRGVRGDTAAQVRQAIAELDSRRDRVQLDGQTFHIDLVMLAPVAFTSAVRSALDAELPGLRPAVIRSRLHLQEEGSPVELAQVLEAIAQEGSSGVLLKAPDHPLVTDAVGKLHDLRIPVVTLDTDLPLSCRIGYVGVDNRAAGATAAYLINLISGDSTSSVLMTLSGRGFRGEEEREIGFRSTMRTLSPSRSIRVVSEPSGLDAPMRDAVGRALEKDPALGAVYSIGGRNLAILEAFRHADRQPVPFVAHDLDDDNARLLNQHQIHVVLHHDLRIDVRHACQLILQAHQAIAGLPRSIPSQVQVVTPFNPLTS